MIRKFNDFIVTESNKKVTDALYKKFQNNRNVLFGLELLLKTYRVQELFDELYGKIEKEKLQGMGMNFVSDIRSNGNQLINERIEFLKKHIFKDSNDIIDYNILGLYMMENNENWAKHELYGVKEGYQKALKKLS